MRSSSPPAAALLAFLCSCHLIAQPPPGAKPLRPLACGAGERVVLQVLPCNTPYTTYVASMNWGAWLDRMPLFGVLGAGGPRMEDHTAEFKAAVAKALSETDLQKTLLGALEHAVKPRTSCGTAFQPASESVPASLPAGEQHVMVKAFLMFQGGSPVLKTQMGVAVLSRNANLAEVQRLSAEAQKISMEIQTMPPKKLLKSGKVGQIQEIVAKLNSAFDSMQNFTAESPARRWQDWVAGGGAVIRQEVETSLEKLAIQVAGALFP